jgi:YD repeat-containing protein
LLLDISSDAGKACTLFDYDNKLVVASIANASSTQVAYSSFEAQNKGGWDYDPQFIISDYSPTGHKILNYPLTGEIYQNLVLSLSIKYVLSFGQKKGSRKLIRFSSFLPLSPQRTFTNTATGWTYYEYLIENESSVGIYSNIPHQPNEPNIKKHIDEVRLYPTTARISTTTYNPLIGKTSECDVNGKITYYEYDDLGRLKIIRDENRNVIKAYEYNYKQ